MDELIDDLLRLSRLGRQSLTWQRVQPADLAREVFDGLAAECPDSHIEFSVADLPPGSADIALLRQVFTNLLSNALKFTRQRDPARIDIGGGVEAGVLTCFVKDNGTGFDMNYADKLFGVFQRLHRADEFEGTGIGLSIVKRIVERHGGRVWAEAQPDQGATFYFTLPETAPRLE
jgi:light-regulated signal transduction histidine kinase (bacteriophytochrome)